jgi:hypothetical protein
MQRNVSPLKEAILQNHEYQGKTNDCGPFCLAMISRSVTSTGAHGKDIAAEFNKTQWKSIFPVVRRIRDWATFPWAISSYLTDLGFKSKWHPFSRYACLIDSIIAPCPPIVIIGSWRPLWAHYMILLESDPIKGLGFADPALPNPELHWFSEKLFIYRWNSMGRMSITTRI